MSGKQKSGVAATKNPLWQKQVYEFAGSISNITGGFAIHELGSIRRIERKTTKSKFVEDYCRDISSIFALNEGQAVLLKHLLSSTLYTGVFKFNEEVCAKWASAVDLKAGTVLDYFRSLCAAKRLIRMVKRGHYKLNSEFVFHPSEIKSADFLSLQIAWVFQPEAGDPPKKTTKKVTLEEIQAMLELYQKQAERDKSKDLFVDDSTSAG